MPLDLVSVPRKRVLIRKLVGVQIPRTSILRMATLPTIVRSILTGTAWSPLHSRTPTALDEQGVLRKQLCPDKFWDGLGKL